MLASPALGFASRMLASPALGFASRMLASPALGFGSLSVLDDPQPAFDHRRDGSHHDHNDMSPGGYFRQMSVVLAATPLLLKKSFAWLGHWNTSGSE